MFNTLAGYAFAKLRFAGRERLFQPLLGALVIPAQVAMIPLFALVKELGLVSTYGGVIVPAMASVFGIFLVRQYALSLPDELLEAARIDGASEARIFWSIVVPLLRPILVTLAILTFLGTWNDFMWPLIVLTDQELHTLPVALAGLSREHVQDNETDDGGLGHHGRARAAPVPRAAALLHRRHPRGRRQGVALERRTAVVGAGLEPAGGRAPRYPVVLAVFLPVVVIAMEQAPQLDLRYLDEMEDVSPWKALASDGVSASVHDAKGVEGNGLVLEFDLATDCGLRGSDPCVADDGAGGLRDFVLDAR